MLGFFVAVGLEDYKKKRNRENSAFLRKTMLLVMMVVAFWASAQSTQSKIEPLDSLLSFRYDTVFQNYERYQKGLELAIATKNPEAELVSYANLMRYFGLRQNLDSTLFYAFKFEGGPYQKVPKKIPYDFFFRKGESLLVDFELVEQALPDLLRAYEFIDATNLTKKAELQNTIAFTYLVKEQYDKAITELESLLKDSVQIEKAYTMQALSVLALAYQYKLKPKKSKQLHQDALAIADQLRDTANAYSYRANMVRDFTLDGDFGVAIASGMRLIDSLPKYRPDLMNMNYYNIGLAHDSIGNSIKAIDFMKRAFSAKNADYNQVEVLDALGRLYLKQDQYKKATEVLKQKEAIVDSIRKKEKAAFVDLYDTKLRIINQEKANEKLAAEGKFLSEQNKRQKQYIALVSVALVCIVLAILAVWIYSKYFKSKAKIKQLEDNERELLKNHIQVRETELSLLAASKARWLGELTEIKKDVSNEAQKYNGLETVNKRLQSFVRETANDSVFSNRLESQYPGMVMVLKEHHPNLTMNDIRQCILVKLGLSLKESAQLLRVGVGAIKMGRNRARLKMELPDNVSFKSYLDEISKNVDMELGTGSST